MHPPATGRGWMVVCHGDVMGAAGVTLCRTRNSEWLSAVGYGARPPMAVVLKPTRSVRAEGSDPLTTDVAFAERRRDATPTALGRGGW